MNKDDIAAYTLSFILLLVGVGFTLLVFAFWGAIAYGIYNILLHLVS